MKTNANVIKLYKNEGNFIFHQYFGSIGAIIYKAYYIVFLILERKIKDNNACSMLCFISLKSIDDINMCKTKYLVLFIAIRSSVSKVYEENIYY